MVSSTTQDRGSLPPRSQVQSFTEEEEPTSSSQMLRDDDEEEEELLSSRNGEPPSNINNGKPGLWIWMLICTASISGLLFGYDTAIISSGLVSLSSPSPSEPIPALTTSQKSLVTSITSLSALLSSLVAGSISDLIGRKPTIFFCALVFIIGALWQALSPTVTQIVIGRWIVGLGVGCGSAMIPMYITELSPTHLRPQLITMNAVFITFGQVIANLVGLAFSHTESGWRQMFAIGALPAAVQVLLLFALPESPRYLASKGKREQASLILTKVYGFKQDDPKTGRVVDNILRGIDRSIKKEQGEVSLFRRWSILFKKRGNRRALYICGGLQALQQLCGFNALIYYSPTIYSGLGFKDPILPSLALTTTNFLFTLTSLILIPKFGKRKVLLWSITLMWISLFTVGYAFRYVKIQQSSLSPTSTFSSSNNHDTTALNIILTSTTIYVAAYAIGLGNIPWQQAEMFPLVVRGLGTSMATSCNWLSNFVVGASFLGLMEGAGASYTFFMFVVICMIGQVGVYWRYPDTDGVELEEVAEIFDREGE